VRAIGATIGVISWLLIYFSVILPLLRKSRLSIFPVSVVKGVTATVASAGGAAKPKKGVVSAKEKSKKTAKSKNDTAIQEKPNESSDYNYTWLYWLLGLIMIAGYMGWFSASKNSRKKHK
jgi:hypothetical protein